MIGGPKPHRLCFTDKIPVVDGELGGDVYGHALSRVAHRTFADAIDHVYLQVEPFTLRDGTPCSRAWVAITVPCAKGSR